MNSAAGERYGEIVHATVMNITASETEVEGRGRFARSMVTERGQTEYLRPIDRTAARVVNAFDRPEEETAEALVARAPRRLIQVGAEQASEALVAPRIEPLITIPSAEPVVERPLVELVKQVDLTDPASFEAAKAQLREALLRDPSMRGLFKATDSDQDLRELVEVLQSA